MNFTRPILAVSIALALAGCTKRTELRPDYDTASQPTRSASGEKRISLSTVETFAPGTATADQVRAALGDPEGRLQTKKTKSEQWVYFDGNYHAPPRLTLTFDPKNHVLTKSLWRVRKADPEVDLKTALARYPHAQFTKTNHGTEEFYTDRHVGLRIVYDQKRNEVASISWIR